MSQEASLGFNILATELIAMKKGPQSNLFDWGFFVPRFLDR